MGHRTGDKQRRQFNVCTRQAAEAVRSQNTMLGEIHMLPLIYCFDKMHRFSKDDKSSPEVSPLQSTNLQQIL